MAQFRLRNYKHKILSFQHNVANLGKHNSGRYCGFDSMTDTVNPLEFNIAHIATGIEYKDVNTNTIGPFGMYLTPQGVIITEDAPIGPFTIDTNAGNGEIRYDLLVANHTQMEITGGTAATYSIIKGTIGNPIKPVLTDPFHQTAIGVIQIPANAETMAGVTWTKMKCPDSGDGEDARLLEINAFAKLQAWAMGANVVANYTTSSVDGPITARLWDLDNDGNTFKILPTAAKTLDGIRLKDVPLQEGIIIKVVINEFVTIRETHLFEAVYSPKGYKAFKINQGLGNIIATTEAVTLGVNPSAGEEWVLEFIYKDSNWFLLSIGGAGTSSSFKRGFIMDWYGDIDANFSDSGMGINLMAGWQMANGNLGTPDTRGRARVTQTTKGNLNAPLIQIGDPGIDEDDRVYGDAGNTYGKNKIAIAQTNLPAYSLPVTDPGHSHTLAPYVSDAANGSSQPSLKGDTNNNDNAYLPTTSVQTGITVASGGSGTKLATITPTYMIVTVMKL